MINCVFNRNYVQNFFFYIAMYMKINIVMILLLICFNNIDSKYESNQGKFFFQIYLLLL